MVELKITSQVQVQDITMEKSINGPSNDSITTNTDDQIATSIKLSKTDTTFATVESETQEYSNNHAVVMTVTESHNDPEALINDHHENGDEKQAKQLENKVHLTASNGSDDLEVPQSAMLTQHLDEEAQLQMCTTDKECEFPKPFYCAWSQQLMTNPVVHPNGTSYEHSVAIQREPNVLFYPNRALKSIIECERQKKKEQGTMMGSIRQLDSSIRSNLQHLINQNPTLTRTASSSSLSTYQVFRPLPDGYYCPITQEIMYDPVIDPEGNTFECKSLKEWLRKNLTSPLTRNRYKASTGTLAFEGSLPTSVEQATDNTSTNHNSATNENSTATVNNSKSGYCLFYRNKALTDLLELELSKSDDTMDPTIRSWRDEVFIAGPSSTDLCSTKTYIRNETAPVAITIISASRVQPTAATTEQHVDDDDDEGRPDKAGGIIFLAIILSLFLSNVLPKFLFYLLLTLFLIIGGGATFVQEVRGRQNATTENQ